MSRKPLKKTFNFNLRKKIAFQEKIEFGYSDKNKIIKQQDNFVDEVITALPPFHIYFKFRSITKHLLPQRINTPLLSI